MLMIVFICMETVITKALLYKMILNKTESFTNYTSVSTSRGSQSISARNTFSVKRNV